MKPHNLLSRLLRAVVATSLITSSSWAAPSEKTTETLVRTSASGSHLQTTLTKNIFRDESYQAEYTVEVPYQDTETYTVSVPYEDTEAYTDYETYYENEYRCENYTDRECGYETVCRTVPDRDCRYESVCHNVPDRECHTERLCTPRPDQCEIAHECGVNSQGQQICKDRKVCRDGGQDCREEQRCTDRYRQECSQQQVCRETSRQECSQEYTCQNVVKQRCGYEQVARTRPVTKYRTVTRYREEQRTRPVTRYRTETRCCVTKTRPVFDHQDSLNVQVRFPAGADLLADEKEKFFVVYDDSKGKSDVRFEILESILGYNVVAQSVSGGSAVIDLSLTPKFKASELGKATLIGLKLDVKPAGTSIIKVVDTGLRKRVETKYTYLIREKETQKIVSQGSIVNLGTPETKIPVSDPLIDEVDYELLFTVNRQGIVLDQPVQFQASALALFNRLPSAQYGSATIRGLQLVEEQGLVYARFQDSGLDRRIEAIYEVLLKDSTDREVAVTKVNAKDVASRADVTIKIATDADLSSDESYKLILRVSRSSPLLDKAVDFSVKASYERKLDLRLFDDAELISDIQIHADGTLSLSDKSPLLKSVTTSYEINLLRPGFLGMGKVSFVQATLLRHHLANGENGHIQLDIVRNLGAEPGAVARSIKKGKTVYVQLTVQRLSPRLNNGRVIVLNKDLKLKVQ